MASTIIMIIAVTLCGLVIGVTIWISAPTAPIFVPILAAFVGSRSFVACSTR